MGSQSFVTYSHGKNAQSAYNKAVEDADDYHGHQEGYSGAINASAGFTDVTNKYKNSGKDLDTYIDERLDNLTKHQGAECICVEEPKGNDNKIKSQVDHIVEPGTKKWVLKYAVINSYGSSIGSYKTKGDAVKAARKHTEETQTSSRVEMRKELEKGSYLTAKISYKKSDKEKPGKWVFFGWASC